MDDYIVLDILLGLIVALFAAIGFWRGAIKEVVVTAGIFAGSALAFRWANPWGGDLADIVEMRADVARIVVAAVALIAATLVLGYGGSSLVGSPDVGLGGRLLGAGLAAINGMLILHYCLWNIERFLTDEGGQEALEQSEVSRLLLRQFGWFLIGAAALGALAIVGGQVVRRRHSAVPLAPVSETDEPMPMAPYDAAGRQRPARLPRVADAGKYEPDARGYDPANERFAADAPSAGQTIPLPAVDAANLAHGGGRGAPTPTRYDGDEWYRRGPAPVQPFDPATPPGQSLANGRSSPDRSTPPQTSRGHAPDPSSPFRSGTNGHAPMVDASAFSWVQRAAHPGWAEPPAAESDADASNGRDPACRVCQAAIGPEDRFCPRCGNPAG